MDPGVKPNLKTKLIWKPHMPRSQLDMGQKSNPKSKNLNPKATVLGHAANTNPTDPPFIGVSLNSLEPVWIASFDNSILYFHNS